MNVDSLQKLEDNWLQSQNVFYQSNRQASFDK